MGLKSTWSQLDGLNITKEKVTSPYILSKSTKNNAKTYVAKVISGAVTINGESINNATENYPILSFRNVTYLPITWRFAHDGFGWNYVWNEKTGLSITSSNAQEEVVDIPSSATNNAIALFNGYYYFVETSGTNNTLYRAPENQLTDKEEIYSYSINATDGAPTELSFQIRDNVLWLVSHIGAGIMGHNEYIKISKSGEPELKYKGYLDFRDTNYGTLFINLGDTPESGNLYLQQNDGETKSVGDSNLMAYAQYVTRLVDGVAMTPTTIIDDDVYVLCKQQVGEPNAIYRINLKTNETKKIASTGVSWFSIENDMLYYIKSDDGMLYSASLDGKNEKRISEHSVAWFNIISENIIYTSKNSKGKFDLYTTNVDGSDTVLLKKDNSNTNRGIR